jgi:hypothetical protein
VHPKRILVKIILLCSFANLAWPQPAKSLFIQNAADKITITTLHPAGPATRSEWKSKKDGLYKLEVDRLRSGQSVLATIRLIHQSRIGWGLMDDQQRTILRITAADIITKRQLHFKVGKQTWTLIVNGEEVPVVTPGIATETEYALNLTLDRIN